CCEKGAYNFHVSVCIKGKGYYLCIPLRRRRLFLDRLSLFVWVFFWVCLVVLVLGCGSRKIFSNKFCGNENGFYLCSPKRKKGFSLPDVRREAAGFSKGWDDFTVFWICVRMLYGSRSVSGGVEVLERY